ncbi:hypothetical protein K9M79_01995 [Candidatus Woesearchaeota archaeon]|nr:hypothetical protein [Candidatus Woesearchaeota archaeon]
MNLRTKIVSMLSLILLVVLGANVFAGAIPVTISDVEMEGTTLTANDTTRVDFERGNRIEVRVELEATGNASDVVVEAFISGYEYSDRQAISDATHVFDVESGVKYVKKLYLDLPDRADEDDYKVRIIVTDRNNDEIVQNYNIKMDVPRHDLAIKDVIFSPEGSVVAGRALLVAARVKNMGEQDEEGIKIKATIPDLGLSASDYVEELEYDESVTSEELYLRIPSCTKEGEYNVKISAYYDDNYESTSVIKTIYVEADECGGTDVDTDSSKVVINVNTDPQDIVMGTTGAVYPMVISNQGKTSKTLTVTTEGTTDWADVKVSPSSVVVVNAGETKTVYLYVSSKESAAAGEHTFVVNVKTDQKTEQVVLKGTVTGGNSGADGSWDQIKSGLEIGLVVLVVLLIILGLIIGFSKLRSNDDDDDQGQTYY